MSTPRPLKIRTATSTDIPVIHDLAHKIWWPSYKGIISDEQISFMLDKMYSEEALQQQMDEGIQFLVAEKESSPVGFAAYSFSGPEEYIFKLQKLYVLPSEQGKGTGKKLIEDVAGLSRSGGGKVLELNVNRGNPAFNFYKKLGFEIYQTVDIPYFGFFMNDYVMRKSL
ncbi:MAG TPA: GNAT family N-acetyltransferase [Sphingobacteriaceae bacterium]